MIGDLLERQLDFHGLVVTDSLGRGHPHRRSYPRAGDGAGHCRGVGDELWTVAWGAWTEEKRELAGDLMVNYMVIVRRRLLEKFCEHGYNEAGDRCLGVLSRNIDDLQTQVKSGSSLSKQDQFLLTKLHELKAEIESELRNFGAAAGDE